MLLSDSVAILCAYVIVIFLKIARQGKGSNDNYSESKYDFYSA